MLERIKEELDIEYERYTRTKFGKLGAAFIYFLVFILVPPILKHLLSYLSLYLQEKHVFVIVLIGTIAMTSVIWNLVMLVVYKLKIPALEQYRVNPDKLWPWEENKQKWKKLLRRNILSAGLQVLVLGPLLLLITLELDDFKVVMDMQKTPGFLQMLPQLMIMMVIQDLVFFWSHWAFHHPLLYRFHKVHHEYTISVSIAGFHFHIFEFFIGQLVNAQLYMMAAMIYAPLHVSTIVYWFIFRTWDAYNGHCGYMFPWAPLQLIPFCTNDEYHDFHHTRNSGNYGSHFRFWDILFGFTKPFREYKLKQRCLKKQ